MGESGMDRLPEGCVAHAIALTSPRDVCRFSAVSSAFRSAAAYDTVWDRFLPSDYRSILSRAVRPVVCSSKRDLFFRLCDSLLIDAGKMVRLLLSIRCSVLFRVNIIFFFIGELGPVSDWNSTTKMRFLVEGTRNIENHHLSGSVFLLFRFRPCSGPQHDRMSRVQSLAVV